MDPEERRPRTSAFAGASFWAAMMIYILAPCYVCACNMAHLEPVYIGSAAVLLGIIGLVDMRRHPSLGRRGWLFALAGLTIGGWSALSSGMAYMHQQNEYPKATCVNNLYRIASAVKLYADDWDGSLPPASDWNGAFPQNVRPTVTYSGPGGNRILLCCIRRKDHAGLPTYAMNAHVAGLRPSDIANADQVPMFFESRPGRNLAGGPELLPHPGRHEGYYLVLFCDGHVRCRRESTLGHLTWQPKMKASHE